MTEPELWSFLDSYPQKDHISIYVYRLWPRIDRSLSGATVKNIDAVPTLDRDYLLKTHGNGKYQIIVVDSSMRGGKGAQVAKCRIDLNEAGYEPVLEYSELDLGHKENRSYVESLRRRGLLPVEGGKVNKTTDGPAVEVLAGAVEKLTDRIIDSKSAPAQSQSEQMTSFLELVEKIESRRPDLLTLLPQLREVFTAGSSGGGVNDKILEILIMRALEPPPPPPPQKSLLEQLDELEEIQERLGRRRSGSNPERPPSWVPELFDAAAPILAPLAEVLAERLRPATVARQNPAPAALPTPEAAPPPAPEVVVVPKGDEMFGSPSRDRIAALIDKALAAFRAGWSGSAFAESIVTLEPDGERIQRMLRTFGADTLLSFVRDVPGIEDVTARPDELRQFVTEFLAWEPGQDDEDEPEEAQEATGVQA